MGVEKNIGKNSTLTLNKKIITSAELQKRDTVVIRSEKEKITIHKKSNIQPNFEAASYHMTKASTHLLIGSIFLLGFISALAIPGQMTRSINPSITNCSYSNLQFNVSIVNNTISIVPIGCVEEKLDINHFGPAVLLASTIPLSLIFIILGLVEMSYADGFVKRIFTGSIIEKIKKSVSSALVSCLFFLLVGVGGITIIGATLGYPITDLFAIKLNLFSISYYLGAIVLIICLIVGQMKHQK